MICRVRKHNKHISWSNREFWIFSIHWCVGKGVFLQNKQKHNWSIHDVNEKSAWVVACVVERETPAQSPHRPMQAKFQSTLKRLSKKPVEMCTTSFSSFGSSRSHSESCFPIRPCPARPFLPLPPPSQMFSISHVSSVFLFSFKSHGWALFFPHKLPSLRSQ